MNLARLRLVTFDVTDTLLQFRISIGKQYSEVGAMYGIHCSENALAANFKSNWNGMKEEHPNFGRMTGLGWDKWWREVVHRTFKDADLNADDKKLDKIATYLINSYQSRSCWQQCYGALGLLSFLRNKGITLGIMSNFDDRLHQVLVNTNIRHYFKFVLTSYDFGFEKPDRRIFDRAMSISQLPDLRADECLHVGDTVILDYIGAIKAGWHAALIEECNIDDLLEKYSYMKAEHVFRNLYDLHKYFVRPDISIKSHF